MTLKSEQLRMEKFKCLLFVLKQSYICYYIICMTVPLRQRYLSLLFLLLTLNIYLFAGN